MMIEFIFCPRNAITEINTIQSCKHKQTPPYAMHAQKAQIGKRVGDLATAQAQDPPGLCQSCAIAQSACHRPQWVHVVVTSPHPRAEIAPKIAG